MNTEDPIQGPYKVIKMDLQKGRDWWVTDGPTGKGPLSTFGEATEQAKALNAAYHEGQRSGWVPVSERLPESNTEVLVALEDCTIPATGQYTQVRRKKGMGWLLPSECHQDGAVTHWMPLPQPPNP